MSCCQIDPHDVCNLNQNIGYQHNHLDESIHTAVCAMHMCKHKDVRMQNPVINKSIPPSILFNSGSAHGWAGTYPSYRRARGRARPGQVYSLMQGWQFTNHFSSWNSLLDVTVGQWLALLSHKKKALGLNPPSGVCMFSPCLHRFSLGTLVSSQDQIRGSTFC